MASLLVGVLVGALYDLFRIGRVVFGGGRLKLFFEDVLFSVKHSIMNKISKQEEFPCRQSAFC